jgi:putative membrane protein
MRDIIRRTCLIALSLFLVSLYLPGLNVSGGFVSYVYAGVLIAILSTILDPFVKVITLPFNILTLGLLSFLTMLISLFILTLFYHNISISNFTFPSINLLGIHINDVSVTGILSYVVISATIYFLTKILSWLFDR